MLEVAAALLAGLGILWVLRSARRARPDYAAIDRMELDLGLREDQRDVDCPFLPDLDDPDARVAYVLRHLDEQIGDYDPDGLKAAYLTEVGLRLGRHGHLTGITG